MLVLEVDLLAALRALLALALALLPHVIALSTFNAPSLRRIPLVIDPLLPAAYTLIIHYLVIDARVILSLAAEDALLAVSALYLVDCLLLISKEGLVAVVLAKGAACGFIKVG